MTLIHEVLERNPLDWSIPNDGVAKVGLPETPEEWSVLRYELQSFVAEGEYEAGLDRILGSYLTHLGGDSQPAAWVSGFFGSGKSHLLKALAALWADLEFPDGARASGLVKLPAGPCRQVPRARHPRPAIRWPVCCSRNAECWRLKRRSLDPGIVFAAAGLPKAYPAARLVLWLRRTTSTNPWSPTSTPTALRSMTSSWTCTCPTSLPQPCSRPSRTTQRPTDAVLDRFAAGFPIVEDLTREEFGAGPREHHQGAQRRRDAVDAARARRAPAVSGR